MTDDVGLDRASGSGLTSQHVELLRRVDLFKRLDRVALARLAACVDAVPVAAGQIVCRQGEAGDALYVVADGAFGVYYRVRSEGAEHRVGRFVRGGFFGEMALLGDEPRSATVRAESAGEV